MLCASITWLIQWMSVLAAVAAAAAAVTMTAGTGWKALSAVSDERMAAEKSGSPGAAAKKTN
jgi:hypothetical protein